MSDKPKKPTTWIVTDNRTKKGSIIPDSMSSFKKVCLKSVSLARCREFIKSHDVEDAKHLKITTQREVKSRKDDGDDYS